MTAHDSLINEDRTLLEKMFFAAVRSAHPGEGIKALLPVRPTGRVVVVGAGKASAKMAKALEEAWPSPLSGLVAVPYGTTTECEHIEVIEAAHPVPDLQGLVAASRIQELVQGLSEDDLVIALISGGGSSLLAAPAVGLTFEDERTINDALLKSGAGITVMNLIRNQFSRIKGGRLALACAPARVLTLVVSDVPGDDPAVVASGPTIPSSGSREEARRAVELHGIDLPPAVAKLLASEENLPPRPDDPIFLRNTVHVIASASASLDAAATVAVEAGLDAHILSDGIEGEASVIGLMHAAIVREVAIRDRPFKKPCVLLSGGETTVTIRGAGRGGRNTEFLLAFAEGIKGIPGVTGLAADTDGIDGNGTQAGAFCDGASTLWMRRAGLDPQTSLKGNDSATAFASIAALFETGPTGTNVNDFRAFLIR